MLTYATPETATPSQLAFHQEHKARQARMRAVASKRLAPPPPPPPPKEPAVSMVKAADVIRKFRVIEWSLERNYDAHIIAFRRWQTECSDVPTMGDIVADFRAICPHPWAVIQGDNRSQEVVVWRQALAHTLRNKTGRSLPEIGRHMGGRDHTTVLYSCRKVDQAIEAGDGHSAFGPCGHRFFIRNHCRKGVR